MTESGVNVRTDSRTKLLQHWISLRNLKKWSDNKIYENNDLGNGNEFSLDVIEKLLIYTSYCLLASTIVFIIEKSVYILTLQQLQTKVIS